MRRIFCALLLVLLSATVGVASGPAASSATASQPKRVKTVRKAKTATTKNAATKWKKVASSGRRSAALGVFHPVPDAGNVPPYAGPPVDHRPVQAVRSPQLRKVHPVPPPKRGDEDEDEAHAEPVRPTPPTEVGGPAGPLQTEMGSMISAPAPAGSGFDGVGVGLGGFAPSSNPPDVNGRVGATQYVQWNNSSFAVFDKTTGALLYGPAAGKTLFQSLGGLCASHNDGDPVVSYDVLAGRWVLSQFVVSGPSGSFSHQCFAVSVTSDALGAYYLYDFVTDPTNFVDYPHVGVWPDGYYMTTHVFNAAGTAQVAARVHVFEREKMLAGLPARQVQKDLSKDGSAFQYGFLPADLDSVTPPPAGEASFVLGPNGQFTNRTDSTRVAVTWGATPTINLTSAVITTVGIASPTCVGGTASTRRCVPQPSPATTADYVDNISFHYMYRLAYRNNGTQSAPQESLVVSAPTAGTGTPAHGAIKWIEFRNNGSSTATPSVYQAGTYDPDTAYRWLPSIAMDKDQNIALGYSKSSTSIKPGIFMTGRLATDPVNTMGAEATMQAGLGVQLAAGNRWGDYSAMTLDPIDQCTFYYTNEYLQSNGSFNWSTRVATFRFPSCTSASPWATITGTITSAATGAPLSGVVVTLSNGFAGASDASGIYSILVPASAAGYSATAACADRNCTTASPAIVAVTANAGATTTQDFVMSGASNLQMNGVTMDDAANGNGNNVVNLNECVRLMIPLKNEGCGNESAISAALTTSTAGVTVTQANSAYGDLVVDASSANVTPFQFQTDGSFVCGTAIDFTLTATYASGSKSFGISLPTCAGGADQTIPATTLGPGALTQSDRLGRDGSPSSCAGKASPGGGFAGTKYYRTYSFTNNSGSATCYTVTINAALGGPGDIESAAYDQTYTPTNLNQNFLGDSGISGLGTTVGTVSYSFTVPANHNFVIVVNTTGTTASSQFSGIVSGFVNPASGPGACAAVPASSLVVSASPATFGGSTNLSATLTTGGSAAAGATVRFTINGSSFGGNIAVTDADGVATLSNVSIAGLNAGTYPIGASFAGSWPNSGASSATGSLIVNKADAMLAVTGGTFTYDGNSHPATGSVSGVGGIVIGTPQLTYNGSAAVPVDAGTYDVVASFAGNTNYNSASATATVTIGKATPTVSVTGGTYTYDGAAHPAVGTVTGIGGANIGAATLTYSPGGSGAPVDAGAYEVTASFGGNNNYEAAAAAMPATVIIGKAKPSLTVTGGTFTYDGDAHPATGSVTGVGGASLGVPAFTYTPGGTAAPVAAGTYAVVASFSGNGNYEAGSAEASIVIQAKAITVTANNAARQFSDPQPVFTATINGLRAGDVLSGTLLFTTTATPSSPAGNYPILASGLSSPNYSIAYLPGTLTVTTEDAVLAYTGETLVATSSSGNKVTATVTLAALAQEAQDGSIGNALAGRSVQFSIFTSTNVSLTTPDYTATAVIGADNTATASITLPADNYVVSMQLMANPYYSAREELASATVVTPDGGQATGGGFLTDANGGRGNFAFTAKYNPGDKALGNSQYIYVDQLDLSAWGAPAGARAYTIMVKANTMSAMDLNATASPKKASFTGKANLFAIDRITGVRYNISGGMNLQYQVDITDNGEGSVAGADQYAMRLWTTTGTYRTVGVYTASGVNTAQVPISGGNIQIR